MSRRSHIPSYRLHRPSGQAVVTLPSGTGDRRDVYLGVYGTDESRAEYLRVVAEWQASGRQLPQPAAATDITINELILRYWAFAEGYYTKNGKPTNQLERVRRSLGPVREKYGYTQARDFGPLALKAVREQMVQAGWVRRYINHCVGCVRRMFRWATEHELVPPSVYHGLQAVEGLKKGRCAARESPPVLPVPEDHLATVLPLLTPAARTMAELQRLTGMRPGEVTIMRPADIDRTGRVWAYRPASHKTEHHGAERVVYLGPKAQRVLWPYLFLPVLTDSTALQLLEAAVEGNDPAVWAVLGDRLQEIGTTWRPADAYLFSPRESVEWRRRELRAKRKSKVPPSQQDRRKRKPKNAPGEVYSVESYDHALAIACRRAGLPRFGANRLRHNAATAVRHRFGLEAAQVTLGHARADVSQLYAERNFDLARRVAEEIG